MLLVTIRSDVLSPQKCTDFEVLFYSTPVTTWSRLDDLVSHLPPPPAGNVIDQFHSLTQLFHGRKFIVGVSPSLQLRACMLAGATTRDVLLCRLFQWHLLVHAAWPIPQQHATNQWLYASAPSSPSFPSFDLLSDPTAWIPDSFDDDFASNSLGQSIDWNEFCQRAARSLQFVDQHSDRFIDGIEALHWNTKHVLLEPSDGATRISMN